MAKKAAPKKAAPKKAAAPKKLVYQLKVTLEGLKPPIWRRLLVPSNLTLADLHYILQIAMGWTNSHMHQFRVGKDFYGVPFEGDDFLKDEDGVKLAQIIAGDKFKFQYEYDMGDSWSHLVVVEKVLPWEKGQVAPTCLAGERQCPPEDCGGIWGFADFLDAMEDPNHPEHANLKEWHGEDFDPEAFDLEEVNRMLTGGKAG